ncbi:Inositol polyphosphate 1-phosphatase [Cryptotermes secundus]|uniref:inositol-1,4-bisphosphate 1-phosphatase n=3 Tax=Cryptotermes secundus TaxID=105785 RepID=A0A2J7QYP6_9NEOP|nr:Inositol polyphosphate 1-phosphatase [Cryptotermes secundus]
MGTSILESLLKVSEKAANIARVIRQDEHLIKLLVQEKKGAEKNPRFVQDFKTLADVLIQETVKHDIGSRFPDIVNHIFGEESNTFSNVLGDTITVQVQADQVATAALLSTVCRSVLSGDTQAAERLALEVHRDLRLEDVDMENLPQLNLPLEQCGIWIDPIDSTSEYISGEEAKLSANDIYKSGLGCVTVLIGVFDRVSGQPILGVVNQPFYTQHGSRWEGMCQWGVKFGDLSKCSASLLRNMEDDRAKVAVLSGSEDPNLKCRLRSAGYVVAEASGAGYKQLCVARGNADLYLLTKGSTFMWDTCGPHAILRSLGGGIVSYKRVLENGENLEEAELKYGANHTAEEQCSASHCNLEGIIAFRDRSLVHELVKILRPS